jgi:glycosyltransferase involved in cell wall biosynthesis
VTVRSLVVSRDIWPWGQNFGAGMRLDLISRTLAGLGPVDLLLLRSAAHTDPPPADSPFARVHTIQQVPMQWPSHVDAMSAYVPEPLRIAEDRKRVAAQMPGWLRAAGYDLVWYNRERTWLTMRGFLTAREIIDVDDLYDVLFERWLGLADVAPENSLSMIQRARMIREIEWWRMVHQFASRQASALVFASEHDRSRFGFANSIAVPNAYEPATEDDQCQERPERPTVLFQGRMTWPPNEDAALWLAKAIAPRIRARTGDVRIVLAGQPSPRVQALAGQPDVDVPGIVPAMAPYLRAAHVVAVPLRAGSGTRIKILEAFAYQVPVVTTTIGAEGLDVVDGMHLEIADTAAGLAARCSDLLADAARRERLAKEAHQLYQSRYRASNVVACIRQAVSMALANGRGVPRGPLPEAGPGRAAGRR